MIKKINQIRVGNFLDEEVLVVVDMDAKVSIVTLNRLPFLVQQLEYIIHCIWLYNDDSNTITEHIDDTDNSTWSVDTYSENGRSYIAAGSNAKTISVIIHL